MKTFTLIILIVSSLFISDLKENIITSKYDCEFISKKKGRCTGSAYCSACKNCSRCAHCSNGGSCGVCGGGASSEYYATPKKSKRTSTAPKQYYGSSTGKSIYYEGEIITVTNEMINLRSGPGLKYNIIEKIYFGQTISYIQKDGEWIKVKIEKTGTLGYVYNKLLNQ